MPPHNCLRSQWRSWALRIKALAMLLVVLGSCELVARAADPQEAAGAADARNAEIDAAIGRLRETGAFVREFHPRGDPQYWVQVISTGVGQETRKEAYNFDDEVLSDVERIARGARLQLHLRHTSITSAGLERLASVGKIELLELTGSNVDDELLKVLPKLPLCGQLALDSGELTDEGLEVLAKCRKVGSVAIAGSRLTKECLESVVELPMLEGVSLGWNFTSDAFEVLARAKNIRELETAWQAAPLLSDYAKFPKLRRLTLWGRDHGDETARTISETFQSLEQAYLRRTSITTAGVEHLSRLKTLKTLTLDGAPIDEDVALPIRQMKQLQWLSLEGCPVGDDTVSAIAECPDLWFLSLSKTHVTDRGISDLIKLKKLRTLYLSSCKNVTNEAIESLKRLPDADGLHLNLQASEIGEEAARELQTALPKANIVWGIPPISLR